MIESIKIKDFATFDEKGVEISNCKKVNFIYGGNGCGKTTISRYLSEQDNSDYQACSIQWDDKGVLPILVYNNYFKEKSFASTDVPGVFTLGEATNEELLAINTKRKELDKHKDDAAKKQGSIKVLKENREEEDLNFREVVWKDIYKKYEFTFKEAFKGSAGSKKSFKDKLLREYSTKINPSLNLSSLTDRAEALFGKELYILELIKSVNGSIITKIEENNYWDKVIVGKQDVNISKLIRKLNNADWVNMGREYIHNDNVCPFCQQETITEKFRKEIEEYFSGEYEENIQQIVKLRESYNITTEEVINKFKDIEQKEKLNNDTKLNIDRYSQNLSSLINIIEANKLVIQQKVKEPSKKIRLNESESLLNKLSKDIEEANNEIKKHNMLVKNYTKESEILISDIWSFLIDENRGVIEAFITKDNGLLQGINNLNKQLDDTNKKVKKLSDEIKVDTRNVTSVEHSVNEINDILKSYDFNGFRIVSSERKNYYQIQRDDGTIANDTLSEGEVSFITFLYYLQCIKGGTTADNVTDNRIIVVDDPISSLDSSVLFIVSSLLKQIIKSTKDDESRIKQVFIFTHNVYFHKEVSFINGRIKEDKNTNYWILKKSSNISEIKAYEMKNPINTSYELLWRELYENSELSSITIQNTMRRILETYFNILGGYRDEDIIEKFPENEREICRSLLCWINDGSHGISDDLYIERPDDIADKYYKVFKRIFVLTRHEEHYNMMMKIDKLS